MKGPDESDEAILARCIERFPELGDAAVDEACAGDPRRADLLRGRLAALQRLGLVPSRGTGSAPASIGRYPILGILGEGGMGAVYLAFDDQLDRNVALKVGHVPTAAGERSEAGARARARFEREIRAVAKLQHPGIVSIHDVGESEGRPYFTMELVEGVTLARVVEELKDRRLGFDQLASEVLQEIVGGETLGARTYVEIVCRWTLEIADALAHAHAHAIVHRDVKPANVMVRRDGRTMLFDLGLARLGEEPGLTRSGDLAGSPFYMSPEQVSGPPERVDRRTDVYSLGVTLFELLTLRKPFEGPTSAQVFRQIASREPPLPRRINPLVPRDLETICLTALEKDPDRRYATIEELAEDLRRFLAFAPIRARPPGALRRAVRFARRNPAIASASALGGLVLVGLPVGLLLANTAIRAEQRRVEQQARLKARVTEFLVNQFHLSDQERELGATISARELLDRGAEKLEGAAFEEDPLVRAELFAATGTVYANLGLYERAIPLLDRAVAIRQSTVGEDPRALAILFEALAGAHLAVGHPETARRLCERGLELCHAVGRAGSLEAVELRQTLAEAALATGDREEAERSLAAALEALRGLHAQPGEHEAAVLEKLGLVAFERRHLESARGRLAESLAIRRKAWSPDVSLLLRGLEELAAVDEALGDHGRAESGRKEAARLASSTRTSSPSTRLPFDLRASWEDQYEASFQLGITSLQSRELPRAIDAFKRCLELDPARSVCAYNVACGYALAGDVEQGLAWLNRAADAGFGAEESRFNVAATDPEIAKLRSEARGERILERMRTNGARARAFAREPEVRLFSRASDELRPLLVVLHADGRTKLDVARGEWARVADEIGADLLAPSGSFPIAGEPEKGMRWLEQPDDLLRRSAECAGGVMDAVRAFLEEHAVDPGRVWIAGEGTGAMVAFEVALRAPGLFRGVLLVDGPIHPNTSTDQAARAASLGMRAGFVLEEGIPSSRLDADSLALRLRTWLLECGFADPTVLRGGAEERSSLIGATLRRWSGR